MRVQRGATVAFGGAGRDADDASAPGSSPRPGRAGEAEDPREDRGDTHRLAALLEHAPVVLFELDRDGRFTLSEGRGLAGLRLSPGQVVGRSVFELYAARPEVTGAVRQALAGERTRRLVRVAGRMFDVIYTPVRDGDGSVARVVGVAHDVTELQERTRALAESEARLRDFVEATSDWLWETDEEHRFVRITARFAEAVGGDPGRYVGLRRSDLRVGDPADGDWAEHERTLAERRPFRDFVYGLVDSDGRRRVVVSSGVPVHGPDGRFLGYRGTARDITRRVEAEERLREGEARFRSLVTNMRNIIFCRVVAGGGRHGYDSDAPRLYGADVQELAGTLDPDGRALIDLWYACVHPDDREAYAAAERRRKELHEPYALDYRIHHPRTGELRWMREVAWVVEDREAGRTYLDSYIVDVTEQKRTEQALRDSRERYQRLIEGTPVAILIYRETRCVYANPSALRLLGARGPEEMVGRRLAELADGDGRQRLQERLTSLGQATAPVSSQEIRCRRLDGRVVMVEASMALITEAGEPAVQLVLVDITARKRAEAGVRHMAQHDALTGLPNRVLLLDRLAQAIGSAGRERRQAALMILDLDGFKEVNDTLGHAAGDVLLREVTRRVRGVARQSDTLARLGGDEFAVVQTGLASPRDAAGLAGRIVDAVSKPFSIDGQEVRVGVSVGISLFPDDAATAGGLLQNADLALYRAKDDGRGRFCFFEAGMNAAAQARRQLALDLAAALGLEGELDLAFQPQVDLRTRRPVGSEALLRWRHPGRGHVPPAEFIPVAEGTGLIRPLGAWVLERACAEASAWAAAGSPVPVSVNISAVQLRDASFGERVEDALARHGLPPSLLCLELTEGLLIDPQLDGVGALLDRLAGIGVRIAIDDFGTGHSSLLNLKRLPVHQIKVDRSFVRGLGRDAESEAIVRATVQLARSLGKLAVAEGVETAAQHRLLRRLGCDRGQGFLYGRPEPAEALRARRGEVPSPRCAPAEEVASAALGA